MHVISLFLGKKEGWEGGRNGERFESGPTKLTLDLQNNEEKVRGVGGIDGDHTLTLKSELGYLRFENLQTLNNSG